MAWMVRFTWFSAPAPEPTWNLNPAVSEPSSSFSPANSVAWEIRSISAMACSTSGAAVVRASTLLPPVLEACTDRSRTRWRSAWTSVNAPSAVSTTEIPSWALRTPTFNPPIWERRPSLMARPAASSAARLIRNPLDSFSSDLLI